MRVLIFGATGMVGRGVLRECLLDPDVTSVLVVGRSPLGQRHEKLEERLLPDPCELGPIADELVGYDACFFCLGVSAAGLSEAEYRAITYDKTLAVAGVLAPRNPRMTFVYVSGSGTDAKSRTTWARVKGETEDALLAMPFRAFAFRPGLIQPLHGIRSKTRLYASFYALLGFTLPLWKALAPGMVISTESVGRAMLAVAKQGSPKRVLESRDIDALGRA